MTQTFVTSDQPSHPLPMESAKSAICWAGILGGVFVTLSLTVVLTILGAGLGFAIKSGWNDAPSAKALGVMSVIWLILVQWVASAVGGYMTGRLRTRWVNVHTHEVFFRDTAHGFVTWATANIIMIALFASLGMSILHHTASVVTPAVVSTASSASPANENTSNAHEGREQRLGAENPLTYYSDRLFRTNGPPAQPSPNEDVRGEASRILMKGIKDSSFSEEDKTYLAQLVTARTGLSDVDAKNRVEDVVSHLNADENQLRELADNTRKTASILSLCLALSMLIGAFSASVAAALGGSTRDRHP